MGGSAMWFTKKESETIERVFQESCLLVFLWESLAFEKKEKSLKKRSEKKKNAIPIFPLCSLSLTTIPHYAWYPIDRNEINNADLQSGKVTR